MKDVLLDEIARRAAWERGNKQKLALLVAEAIAAGATWADIGQAAAIRKTTAHKRWSEAGQASNRAAAQRTRERARGELPLGGVKSLRGQRGFRWKRVA